MCFLLLCEATSAINIMRRRGVEFRLTLSVFLLAPFITIFSLSYFKKESHCSVLEDFGYLRGMR